MTVNNLLMQFQADILGRSVVTPATNETTALGAAYAAGLATGFYSDIGDLRDNWIAEREWNPKLEDASRNEMFRTWKKAVTRSFDWTVASGE